MTYLAASLLHSGPSSNPLYIHNAKKRRGEEKEREKEKEREERESKTKKMQLLIQDNECVYSVANDYNYYHVTCDTRLLPIVFVSQVNL